MQRWQRLNFWEFGLTNFFHLNVHGFPFHFVGWSVRSLSVMVPLFGRLCVDFPGIVVLGLLFQQVVMCRLSNTIQKGLEFFSSVALRSIANLRMGSWMVYNRLRSIAVWRQLFPH